MNTELTKAAHGARRQQVIAAATVPVFFGLVACTGRDERMGEVANAVTVTCVDIVADRDATLSDPPMAKNFGTKPILRVGGKDETVLHFDLGSVPATSVIDRATLQLFVAESESSTPIFVHRATQNWSEETITFANFGQAFAPNVIAGFVTTSTNVMKNVDITQQVTRWLSGEHTNHGLVLVSAANEKAVIISREGGTAAQKPQLRVCYAQHVDHCASDPCQNSGTCENTPTSYTCHCQPGFTGTNCETNVDDCAASPCINGVCVDEEAGYTCSCPVGFAGTHCEINIDDCTAAPCLNGGVCQDAIASHTCHCAPGYGGDNCETLIDNCAASPCQNGGSCTNGVDAYTCSCPNGFTGINCEIDVDDCAAQPCKNNGTCIDGTASFTCVCPPDWGGTLCEINLNNCAQQPCLNGASCTNAYGTYTCTCADGYAGTTCEIDVDDCASAPCQNGGACIDGVDAYTCTCPEAYEGEHCEIAKAWQNPVNVAANGTSLLKAGTAADWDAGASSFQTIASGQEGYMEFTAGEINTYRVAGLGVGDGDQSYADVDFAVSLSAGGGLGVYESGQYRGSFGAFNSGDRMRVEVIDGHVRYLRNGAIFYSSTQPVPAEALRIDTSLFSAGATIQNAVIATCSAGDANCHRTLTWNNAAFVSTDGDSLNKDLGSNGWFGGASSLESISCGRGYTTFVATETTTDRMIGLGDGDTDASYLDIEYAIRLAANGSFSVYESGTSRGVFGTYVTGDVFRVEIDLLTVRYSRNGAVFYTSTVPASPLAYYRVDASLYDQGATIEGVTLVDLDAGADATCGALAFWTGVHADTLAKSNHLLRASGDAAFNTGAFSIAAIPSGQNGYMEFTAGETNTHRVAGLGTDHVDHDYTDIEFAIFLAAGGAFSVYESGQYRGTFGAYSRGDRMRVEVLDGQVRYLRNGAVFYTSALAPPTAPLHIDTSLWSVGATIQDAVITCAGC